MVRDDVIQEVAVAVEPIPQFDLQRQLGTIGAEIESAVARVIRSGRYALGPETAALEKELSRKLGVAHALTCASGTDALLLALRAVGVGPGDTVLTTSFSFFATAGAILQAGAIPFFADVEPGSFNIDSRGVQAALHRASLRPAAILVVHLYGRICNMCEFEAIGREFSAPVIEDAAQAFGARYEGRSAGSLGAAGCLSFYPTKNLAAAGEGGLVTTNSPDIAERVRLLRSHGSPRRYEHAIVGWNSRLDEVQAAVLRVKLRHVDGWIARRREIARRYDRGLRGSAVTVPEIVEEHAWHQYVVRSPRRDALRAYLQQRGISTEVYYPVPIHLQPAVANLGYSEGAFPEAERASREVLALPMFPELADDEVDRVVAAIREFAEV